MNQHFNLTIAEFNDNNAVFGILEIKAEQVVGKNYQDLSDFLKKQFRKLSLVNHPDKGGDKNRFDQIHKAYQELKKYIEPLKSGEPCIKVSIDTESDGRLTKKELHYGKKLFDKLDIGEEAIGKDFEELNSILRKKSPSGFLRMNDNVFIYLQALRDYISPLQQKSNLIKEDKKALALKFIERKNILLLVPAVSILPLALLTTVTIVCYLSWWIIAVNILTNKVFGSLVNHYMEKYKNSEISTDEFMSKMNYIQLSSKLLYNYPLAAFSVYLLATNFVSNGLTVGGVILGSLLTLAIVIEVLAPIFSKGCEIYADKNMRDLLEEDPKDRIQKETDLLKWYDPRLLLMPIIMPLVRMCFKDIAEELGERNLDEVNTNMSDVSGKPPEQPQAIEFAQQGVA